MSFLINGGYNAIRKQILNICLKPTTIWSHGIVFVNKNMVACTLNPMNENKLEIVNYNNTATLLLNNTIIYENSKLFTYNIELNVIDNKVILNDNSLDKHISHEFIDYINMKKYNTERYLN
jgi:hypothetical protein